MSLSTLITSTTMNSSQQRPPTITTTTTNIYLLQHGRRRTNFTFKAAAVVSSPKERLGTKPPFIPQPAVDHVTPKRVSAESLQYESGHLGTVPERRASSSEYSSGTLAMKQLTSILTSKVYDVAVESPLQLAEKLSHKLGTNIWFKREDIQPVRVTLVLKVFVSYCLILYAYTNILGS